MDTCGDTCFYVCPHTWLNEARTNIGLSSTMGFLNKKDSLTYFAILGELSSGLSFAVGFFNISWLFKGASKDITQKRIFFGFLP